MLFPNGNSNKEPKVRKRSKKSGDSSKNLSGGVKTFCEKRVSSKKQKQENSSVDRKSPERSEVKS